MDSPRLNLFNKKIVLAPLDWGLGHAARCVPLIKQLQQQNNSLVIACTAEQKYFLEQELSGVDFMNLPGYKVRYASLLPLWIKIFSQLPRLFYLVRKENKILADYLQHHKTDTVISDNRFGFYHKSVESIFITHQLNIQTPFFKKQVNSLNRSFIKRFNICWVPDYEQKEKRLSGILSDKKPSVKNVEFIGPLSRFVKKTPPVKKYHVLVLLSGPEPQRSILEKKISSVFMDTKYKVALVRGTSGMQPINLPDNFYITDIASSAKLQELFDKSHKIICRSGYSTLMDLHALGLRALLIPTPGQTEQEYLADYWKDKFGCMHLTQKNITKESVESFMKSE